MELVLLLVDDESLLHFVDQSCALGYIQERGADLLVSLALNTCPLGDAFRALLLHALEDSITFDSRDSMQGGASAFLLGVNGLAKEESRDTLVQLQKSVLTQFSHLTSLFLLSLLLVLFVFFFLSLLLEFRLLLSLLL